VSGRTDAAPSVSWVDPSGGETVSGSVAVRIDASDGEDDTGTLDVTYTVDGGSPRSTTFTSAGYYEDTWDTTAVVDDDHTLAATATDAAGNSSSRSITVATDNTESVPAVDSLSASEVETADADAAFDTDWAVSDPDGDLASVDLALVRDADGSTEDRATVDVGGDTASGTTRLVAAGDEGSGNHYTVEVTVTDGSTSVSDTTSVTETEETNSAPTVSVGVTDESNPAWTRYDVDWTVADTDGDLAAVTTALCDSSGGVLDSVSESVSGDTASGTHAVGTKDRRGASEIRVTVTDAAGGSTSTTTTV
jgi:subtilisin